MNKLNNKSGFVDHTKNIIEVRNVFFAYERGESILENISFDIHKGDYIGFVGPNGSGKTTLIKIILGLIKPDKGKMKIFDQDFRNFKEWYRIGYVPQKIVGVDKNFPLTVFEAVTLGGYRREKIWKKAEFPAEEFVLEILEKVGMSGFRNRLIGDLSGGQLQRVYIARALVNNPEIIFLDEPTSGIDKKNQDDFYRLLQYLNKEMGITLIMVSHDIERLSREVMHIMCIDKTLKCHLTPKDFIRETELFNVSNREVKIAFKHKHNN
ncbi:MAG: metal ABC transporter ATP-binding protein [Candidatus Moraniibacteriota bacterium]